MKTKLTCLLLALALVSTCGSLAQNDQPKSREEVLKLLKSLKYQQREINLPGGFAKIEVPTNFNYLGPADAETVLVKLWGNPPGKEKSLGLLIPAGETPVDDGCWVVTIHYQADGYVKDDDANKINYDKLLESMKKGTAKQSAERERQGYPGIELVGWAAPPHYDSTTHKLYWAMDLKVKDQPEHTLNYNIRMLGRRGVLVLNAISGVQQLGEIEKETPQILSMVNFNDGNRYADFDPKVDKVATYGLAALVAGGIAAKLGFFKLIWVFILAAKKLIIVAFVAIAGFFKKIFGGKSKNTPAT
ncbi:MAG TPA: DUF2167 domain-containing protein [Verrucomicrobiae bacterium]|nr:DUF2167 domain-containing protein [Verrucomicrobiae bacterium]